MRDAALSFHQLTAVAGGRMGRHDAPCPLCGPERRSPTNRARKVLRVWLVSPSFASFHCARCGEHGFAFEGRNRRVSPATFARVNVEIGERERAEAAAKLARARALWQRRRSLSGSPAERYLREVRGYSGPLPATLGFLPACGEFPPAMVAAFGIPEEPEPGMLAVPLDAVRGVHLTRLKPDGSGKAGTEQPDKIMLARSLGSAIVLAPVNDGLGLAICEGIEDALSIHEATGLGAWAAGAASRLPALATGVPGYVEAVTIVADADSNGTRCAAELAEALRAREMEVHVSTPGAEWVAA